MKQNLSKTKHESILITGASTGIGLATALHLASHGYRVIAGIRKTEDAARLMFASKDSIEPVILDVTNPNQIDEAYARVQELCGAQGLKALVNNAGYNYNSAFECSDEQLARKMMEVNFFGVVRITQKFIPLLRQNAQSSGYTAKLVNVGSIGSLLGFPWESFYHASKFAVLGLTESLRYELYVQGIRVTAVLPGAIKSEFARKTGDSISSAIECMGAEERSLYGNGLRQMSKMVPVADRWGARPELVARRIESIIDSENPRMTYIVGTDAHLMHILSNLVSREVFHLMFRKTFGA